MRNLAVWMWMMCAGCVATNVAGASPAPVSPTGKTEARSAEQVGAGTVKAPLKAASVGWLGAGLERDKVLAGASAVTHLGVWLDVPREALATSNRPGMSLALVVDVSGSMHGEKIARAREAAQRFVDHLKDGDEVALYAFDDQVMEVMPPVVLEEASRERLARAIAGLRDDGNTNMYGAVSAGLSAVKRAPASRPIRRVVLLSDGRANVGPSAPQDFAQLARTGADQGSQVTALGIGLDYDENTLGALAMNSEGRMYHLEHVEQLAKILEQELDLLGRTVGTDAYVELDAAEGVNVDAIDNGRLERQGSRVRVPVGTLYAGQEREFLLRVSLQAGQAGARPFGQVRLNYVDRSGQARSQRLELGYAVTADAQLAARSGHERVHAMVASVQAAEAQLAAARMLNEGNSQGASQVLQQAEQQLEVAARKSSGKNRAKLKKRAKKVLRVQQRAAQSRTQSEARGAALDAYDDALEAQGF